MVDNWGGFEWAGTQGDAATFIDGIAEDGLPEPRLFIAHGTNDQTVPYWHTQEIVDQADIVGMPYTLFANVGAGHGFDLHTTEYFPWGQRLPDSGELARRESGRRAEYVVNHHSPTVP